MLVISCFEIVFSSNNMIHVLNMVIIEGGGKWLSWGCKVYAWFHLSEPLFSPLSCLGTCWLEISLQVSLETTLMSHTNLAHQYFTSKPNLLRMTTYHRQDMSFTAATFTFSVCSICTHPHRHIHVLYTAHVLTYTHTNYCAYFLCHISSTGTCDGVVLFTNNLAIPLKYLKSHTVPGPKFLLIWYGN